MFDAKLFLSKFGQNPVTTVKAHDCRLKLSGRPAGDSMTDLCELATEQTTNVRVTEPKVELPTGQVFQPRCELSGQHTAMFIAGQEPAEKGRKGTGKTATPAHAEEVPNGKA